jgi:HlyD family secretion protein
LKSLQVTENKEVRAEDILGYLDSHSEAEAQRDAAKTVLDEAKSRLEAEMAYNEALVLQAKIGLREAEALDPLDIKAQKVKVSLLESALDTHRDELDHMKKVTSGAISAQQLGQQKLLVLHDEVELEAAKVMLEKARAGADLKLEVARAQVGAADAALKRVAVSAQLDSLKKNVDLAEARLQRTILRAPRDGRILRILTHPGERADRLPILRMADTSVMYAVAEVYETDIIRVEEGQKARVRSPALLHELTGTVERKGLMVSKNEVLHVDPAADVDARVVNVWIRLDSPKEVAEMTDLQVDVKIKVGAPPQSSLAGQSKSP